MNAVTDAMSANQTISRQVLNSDALRARLLTAGTGTALGGTAGRWRAVTDLAFPPPHLVQLRCVATQRTLSATSPRIGAVGIAKLSHAARPQPLGRIYAFRPLGRPTAPRSVHRPLSRL